jgi:uncharacterized membrane protein
MDNVNRSTQPDASAWPRWLNLVLGVWLFISAFVWPHTASEQTNAWIVGILMVVAAVWAMYAPPVRFVNTVLAIWLFFSSLGFVHQNAGTLWNNLILAVVVFIVSLIPSNAATMPTGGRRHAMASP